jgi:hypothetical protein
MFLLRIIFFGCTYYSSRRHTLLSTKKYTDKKENEIFLIHKEIQTGAVAKSYMTKGLLKYTATAIPFIYSFSGNSVSG